MMLAAGEGNSSAISLLKEFGGDVKAKTKGGYTALLLAVLNNQIEAVKTLVAHGANVEDKAPDGTTALNMAAINAYYDLGAVLLDLGANPNAADPRGSTLHTVVWLNKPGTSWEAAGLGQDPETVPRPEGRLNAYTFARKLLEKGADVNKRVDFKEMTMSKSLGTTRNPPNINLGRHHMSFVGTTPFYNAARNGDAPMMRLLLEFKADPKITNNVGVTPLMAAAGIDYYEGESPGPRTGVSEAERLEALKLAFETGGGRATVNQKTHLGDYPIVGSPEFTLLTYPENVEDLLGLGVGDPRWDGFTAVHSAILSNQPTLLQFLVDNGGDPELKTRLGWSPLMITKGIFMANSKTEFPEAAKILEAAIAKKKAAAN
jgi:ankyrin repeat protein